MKSSACQARQRKLEGEIKNMAETTTKPSTSTSLTSNTPPRPSNPLFTPNLPVCQGAELVLSTNAWENYPWHIHAPGFIKSPSFYICSINRTGEILHVRSHSCTGFASQPGHPCCGACRDKLSSHELKSIVQRVHTEIPVNGLNIQYYSYRQLVGLIKTKDEELKKYRLKGLEINRKAERLLGKLNDRQHQDIHEL
ncbi:hypothetical protein FRC08_017059 [Ceratobasidium sp. 394]|nr:hypothetical protein FRC08_017059 [Ceratobasidium sp. 394]